MKVNRSILILLLSVNAGIATSQQSGETPRRREAPQTIQLAGGSRVEFRKFRSAALGREAEYSIFLPVSYQQSTDREFPVIYFLHGLNNDHTSWTMPRYGEIPAKIETLINSGTVPPFVMIHPDGENSFYTDRADGSLRYEEYITADLVQEVERNFRIKRERASRAVGGTSMGGYGALKLAFKHPNLFSSVAGTSPIVLLGDNPLALLANVSAERAQFFSRLFNPVFGEPFDQVHWKKNSLENLARSSDLSDIHIYFSYGTADRYNNLFPMEIGVRTLDRILAERGVPHTFRVFDGEPHGWELVAAHLDETILFLTQAF